MIRSSHSLAQAPMPLPDFRKQVFSIVEKVSLTNVVLGYTILPLFGQRSNGILAYNSELMDTLVAHDEPSRGH
jgi:hypothetical protein